MIALGDTSTMEVELSLKISHSNIFCVFFYGKAACTKAVAAVPQPQNTTKITLRYNSNVFCYHGYAATVSVHAALPHKNIFATMS